ncbi:MAG: M20/M25/M40 family metallo-hydrolase [Bacteriovoracaceae bacterium]|nr:M20/M25/M40 family metallo-hydrolase [Bacteriovoracaceae bacterium]
MDNSDQDQIVTQLVFLTERLVEFKTTASNLEQLHLVKDFVINYFKHSGLHIARHQFNSLPALVITTKKTKTPKVLLQAHLDVVDGDQSQFIPTIINDRLYGRGTSDMKGFAAISMHLLKEIAASKDDLDIGLMLTFDEEVGSLNGALKLAELGYSADIIINGDGGHNHSVIYAEKGILKFKLEASANPGRHPYVWEGENAFDILMGSYCKIKELCDNQHRASALDNWYSTHSVYDINVKNENHYPPHFAELKMNIYYTWALTINEVKKKIEALLHKRVTFTPLTESERVYLDPACHYIAKLQEIMTKHFNRQIHIKAENGSSDARYFANLDIPILILKVVGEDHHGSNEHLCIPSLLPLYLSVKEFIYNTNFSLLV